MCTVIIALRTHVCSSNVTIVVYVVLVQSLSHFILLHGEKTTRSSLLTCGRYHCMAELVDLTIGATASAEPIIIGESPVQGNSLANNVDLHLDPSWISPLPQGSEFRQNS